MKTEQRTKYDTGINILGSIPDYAEMIQYIVSSADAVDDANFSFRTSRSTERFRTAIAAHLMQFASDKHRAYFIETLKREDLSLQNKYLILFWQLTYTNALFRRITEEVYMKAVYQGRTYITAEEILAFMHYLKEQEPDDLTWSEATLKITGSKYLTLLKKLGLLGGAIKKTILHPLVSNELFVYFIRFAQLVCPQDRTLHNPYMKFSFQDEDMLIKRLKDIDNMAYWDITQIGKDITIDLKDYE